MRTLLLISLCLAACASHHGQYVLTYGDSQGQAHPVYFKDHAACLEVYKETIRRRVNGYQTLSVCTYIEAL